MKQPNIILIVCDQLRYDCVGAGKTYPVKTPNLDRLASEGMSFTNSYTSIPICCPARMSLLSGKRSESFSAYWNFDITLPVPSLTPADYTFTKALSEAGYRTAYVGKWHGSENYTPLDFGFDSYYSEGDYFAEVREAFPEHRFVSDWKGGVDELPLEYSKTHSMARKAIETLDRLKACGAPYHLRLDFSEPHLPCVPNKKFLDLYSPETVPKWGSFGDTFENKPYIQEQQLCNWGLEDMTWEDWSQTVARYYGIITQMDDAVGKLMAYMDKNGLWDNTLLIFTTNHGDMCGAHRMMDKHYNMYEDIVKVPLIVRWKDVVKPASVCHEYVVNTLDIAPTVCEAAGLPLQPDFHGYSLKELLTGAGHGARDCAVSTYNGQQFGLYCERMIVSDGIKYIWNLTDIDELYDLKNDPYELNNRIDDQAYAGILSVLRKKLYDELKRCGDGLLRGSWLDNQLLNGKKITKRKGYFQ